MDKEKALDLMPTGDDFILIPKEVEVKDMMDFMEKEFAKTKRVPASEIVIHFKTERLRELCEYVPRFLPQNSPFMVLCTTSPSYSITKYLKLCIGVFWVAVIHELPINEELHLNLRAWMIRNYKFTNKLRLEVEAEEDKVYRSEVAKYYEQKNKK